MLGDERARSQARALDVTDDGAVLRLANERARVAGDPVERIREMIARADGIYRDETLQMNGVMAVLRYASKKGRALAWFRGIARKAVLVPWPDVSVERSLVPLGASASGYDVYRPVEWRHFLLVLRDEAAGFYALEMRTGKRTEQVGSAFPEVLKGRIEGDEAARRVERLARARRWALAEDSKAIILTQAYVDGPGRWEPGSPYAVTGCRFPLWEDPLVLETAEAKAERKRRDREAGP